MNSSSEMFQMVSEFQFKVLGNQKPDIPVRLQSEAVVELARRFHEEEQEFLEAHQERDIVKMADSLADLIYFALGAAYLMGLPFDEIFRVVHTANMTKVRGLSTRGYQGSIGDASKPVGWVPPEEFIRQILRRAYEQGKA